jgi:hypothetical protein
MLMAEKPDAGVRAGIGPRPGSKAIFCAAGEGQAMDDVVTAVRDAALALARRFGDVVPAPTCDGDVIPVLLASVGEFRISVVADDGRALLAPPSDSIASGGQARMSDACEVALCVWSPAVGKLARLRWKGEERPRKLTFRSGEWRDRLILLARSP